MKSLSKKISNFYGDRDNYKRENRLKYIQKITDRSVSKILSIKIVRFGRNKKTGEYAGMRFNAKQLLEKIGEDPVCQLTGRPIDLSDGPSYHLDHIVPKTKGGDNSLSNCQILCREANQAKGDLTPEEFLKLCEEVISWNKAQGVGRFIESNNNKKG